VCVCRGVLNGWNKFFRSVFPETGAAKAVAVPFVERPRQVNLIPVNAAVILFNSIQRTDTGIPAVVQHDTTAEYFRVQVRRFDRHKREACGPRIFFDRIHPGRPGTHLNLRRNQLHPPPREFPFFRSGSDVDCSAVEWERANQCDQGSRSPFNSWVPFQVVQGVATVFWYYIC